MPTGEPSFVPTLMPTIRPSDLPSVPPTQWPTNLPSPGPSFSPSWIPSVSPSGAPTWSPTWVPSEVPTTLPSSLPSMDPTFIPSILPTLMPSSSPSVSPSSQPTYYPSHAPTLMPSTWPSIYPSIIPSQVPTVFPSLLPTASPSMVPTLIPTLTPSTSPSGEPTVVPSFVPTMIPTDFPSIAPSLLPTVMPSCFPTNHPTLLPSLIPTLLPSGEPTLIPTLVPTNMPSLKPSQWPSTWPSIFPTNMPSHIPSFIPTIVLSIDPSATPSATPTLIPTLIPTDFPTLTPSALPTTWPSSLPTTHPSFEPTFALTIMPSGEPSFVPTLRPTIHPTDLPTLPPTQWPTNVPSPGPSFSPSWIPSISPSGTPTWKATWVPTICPSTLLAAKPTRIPSFTPTNLSTQTTPESFLYFLPTQVEINDMLIIDPHSIEGDATVMFTGSYRETGHGSSDLLIGLRHKNDAFTLQTFSASASISGIAIRALTNGTYLIIATVLEYSSPLHLSHLRGLGYKSTVSEEYGILLAKIKYTGLSIEVLSTKKLPTIRANTNHLLTFADSNTLIFSGVDDSNDAFISYFDYEHNNMTKNTIFFEETSNTGLINWKLSSDNAYAMSYVQSDLIGNSKEGIVVVAPVYLKNATEFYGFRVPCLNSTRAISSHSDKLIMMGSACNGSLVIIHAAKDGTLINAMRVDSNHKMQVTAIQWSSIEEIVMCGILTYYNASKVTSHFFLAVMNTADYIISIRNFYGVSNEQDDCILKPKKNGGHLISFKGSKNNLGQTDSNQNIEHCELSTGIPDVKTHVINISEHVSHVRYNLASTKLSLFSENFNVMLNKTKKSSAEFACPENVEKNTREKTHNDWLLVNDNLVWVIVAPILFSICFFSIILYCRYSGKKNSSSISDAPVIRGESFAFSQVTATTNQQYSNADDTVSVIMIELEEKTDDLEKNGQSKLITSGLESTNLSSLLGG